MFQIHVSFSLSGDNPNSGSPQGELPIINLLTQSIGVTLTDVNDVVFKLVSLLILYFTNSFESVIFTRGILS